jgi:hypothetical protein
MTLNLPPPLPTHAPNSAMSLSVRGHSLPTQNEPTTVFTRAVLCASKQLWFGRQS